MSLDYAVETPDQPESGTDNPRCPTAAMPAVATSCWSPRAVRGAGSSPNEAFYGSGSGADINTAWQMPSWFTYHCHNQETSANYDQPVGLVDDGKTVNAFQRPKYWSECQRVQWLQLGVSTMSIAWDDPVSFGWDSSQLLVGRTMTLGTAIDYFASLSPEQKICARISLSSPLQLSRELPPAYELNGGKIDTLVALRQASRARLAA